MSYIFIRDLVSTKNKKKRPGIYLTATSITVHNTSNDAPARNERKWLDNVINIRSASWHYCVDDKEVIQAIPTNEVAYHAQNDGWKTSIGVEISEFNWEESRANAVKFLAQLLYDKNWGIDKLRQHNDWYPLKDCPRVIRKEGWNKFIFDVDQALKELKKPEPLPILKIGACGSAVKRVQRALKINDDGVFGPITLKYLIAFQKSNGLVPDGIVGAKTYKALGIK